MSLVSSKLEVISRNQMNQIHEGSLKILGETGVVFHSEKARELFKKHGAKVEGLTVFIPEKLVDQAIEDSPANYRHRALNPDNDAIVGNRQKRPAFSGIYGPVFVLDPEEGRRPGTLADYRNFIKLFQETPLVNIVGGMQIEPCDADRKKKFFQLMHIIIKHTDKAYWGFPGLTHELMQQFEMVKMALGLDGQPLDKPYIGTAVCPLSPLRFTQEHGDTIMTYAAHNQAIYINSCIMAGVSGPISLLGTATLINTEILAGAVLAQLTRPGSPVAYVSGGTVADLRSGMYTGGGPESNLIVLAGLQMALDMYRMPTRVMGGLSDAKEIDYQAGAETLQNLMMPMLAGAHFINNALGNLDGQLTTSFEKFLLDTESADRVLRVMRGIDGDDQDLSLELITELSHSGNYLMHKNTFDNYRRRWRPGLSIWDEYLTWQKSGAPKVVERGSSKIPADNRERPGIHDQPRAGPGPGQVCGQCRLGLSVTARRMRAFSCGGQSGSAMFCCRRGMGFNG